MNHKIFRVQTVKFTFRAIQNLARKTEIPCDSLYIQNLARKTEFPCDSLKENEFHLQRIARILYSSSTRALVQLSFEIKTLKLGFGSVTTIWLKKFRKSLILSMDQVKSIFSAEIQFAALRKFLHVTLNCVTLEFLKQIIDIWFHGNPGPGSCQDLI